MTTFRKFLWAGLLFAAIGFAATASAAAEPTIHEVYQAAEAGKLSEAQAMMHTVLRNHPNSAKAHYVQAELLAKQGKLASAGMELKTAERLAPGLPFANKEAVESLRLRISGAQVASHAPSRSGSPAAARPGGIPMSLVLIGIAAIAALAFFVRVMRQRTHQTPWPASGPSYGVGTATATPAGPAGVASTSGLGSSVLGGLATGAALGAGMVAGESLMHRLTDRERGSTTEAFADHGALSRGDDFSPDWSRVAENLGGNDFGIADDSSWDDSASGDDWT